MPCRIPKNIQVLTFSSSRYPHIKAHALAAIRHGWPRILVIDRTGAAQRRERLLRGILTAPGEDRDEYPPAVGRGRGPHLTRGVNPTGWMADVLLVPSGENRSHGDALGNQLRGLCNGVRFRYSWT